MNCSENTSTLTRKPHFTSQREPDAIQLKVELPGVSKEGVNLDFVDDVLTITGTYQNQAPAQWQSLRRELCSQDYSLQLRVSAPIESGSITATLTDGILAVKLPIREAAKARKIGIN